MSDTTQHRYDYIDSIRGIAALCVVFEHTLGIIARHMSEAQYAYAVSVGSVFGFGKFGVVLFFMVSGFVVPFSLKGERVEGLRHFAISRFFRLYPIYWLSIIAAVVFISSALDPAPTWREGLINVTMLQQFFGVPNIQPLYWTLQIEIIFYLFCAALFFFGQLNKPAAVFVSALGFLVMAFVLAIARYQFERKLPVAAPLALLLMCFGLLYRQGYVAGEALAKRYAQRLLLLCVVAIPAVAMLAYGKDKAPDEAWTVYTASYLSALLVFLLLTTRFKITDLGFVHAGRISYSIYLFHPVVIVLYRNAMGDLLYRLPILVHFVIVVSMTLAVSHILFKYVEAPSIAIGKRLIGASKSRLTKYASAAASR